MSITNANNYRLVYPRRKMDPQRTPLRASAEDFIHCPEPFRHHAHHACFCAILAPSGMAKPSSRRKPRRPLMR